MGPTYRLRPPRKRCPTDSGVHPYAPQNLVRAARIGLDPLARPADVPSFLAYARSAGFSPYRQNSGRLSLTDVGIHDEPGVGPSCIPLLVGIGPGTCAEIVLCRFVSRSRSGSLCGAVAVALTVGHHLGFARDWHALAQQFFLQSKHRLT